MFSLFSRKAPPSATLACPANPCAAAKGKDEDLVKAVAERHKKLTGQDMVTTGNPPGDFGQEFCLANPSKCQSMAHEMLPITRRFNRYS